MDNEEMDLLGIDNTGIDELIDANEKTDEEELEGLARRYNMHYSRGFRRHMRPMIRRHVQRAIQKTGRSLTTKGQALLLKKTSWLSPNTRDAIKNKSVKFRDLVYYIRRDITEKNGITELIQASIDRDDGVTNFEKGRLPSKVNMMLQRVEINFDQSSGITEKTADLDALTSADDNGLFNGELELKVGSRTVFRLPVNSFVNPDRRNPLGPKNGFNFSAPELIKEDEDIQLSLHLVGSLPAAGTASSIIEVKLVGDGIAPDR